MWRGIVAKQTHHQMGPETGTPLTASIRDLLGTLTVAQPVSNHPVICRTRPLRPVFSRGPGLNVGSDGIYREVCHVSCPPGKYRNNSSDQAMLSAAALAVQQFDKTAAACRSVRFPVPLRCHSQPVSLTVHHLTSHSCLVPSYSPSHEDSVTLDTEHLQGPLDTKR